MLTGYAFVYILTAAVLFFGLGLIWTKTNWFNFFLKFLWFIISFAGFALLIHKP